jgi:hypothetical protein
MAVPTVVDFESQEVGTDQTSVTIANPTGTADEDLLIAIINTGIVGNVITPPAGWRAFHDDNSPAALAFTQQVFYRFWNTGDPTSHQFNFSNAEQTCSQIITIRGVDQYTPLDAFPTPSTGTTATPTCPDIGGTPTGTTVDECLILRLFGADDDDITLDSGYPAGHTGLYVRESSAAGSSCSSGAAWETQPTAGAPGSAAFTLTATEGWTAWTIAISPPQPALPSNPDIKSNWYQFTAPAGAGNQAFTGVGFQPKALLIFATHMTTDGPVVHSENMIGATDFTNSRVVVVAEQDAAQNTRRDLDEAACILIIDETTDADVVRATPVSADADGFTLNFSPTSSGVRFLALVLGGDDLDAHVGQDAADDSPVTSIGHRPELVFAFSAGLAEAGAPSQHSIHGWGCFDANFDQWCVLSFQGADTADQTNKDSVLFSDAFIGQLYQGARTWASSITAFTNKGFAWTGQNADAFYFLSVNMSRRKSFIGTFTSITTTGNQDLPDFGFVPQGYLLSSGGKVDEVATTPTGVEAVWGGFNSVTDGTGAYASQNSATNANQNSDLNDVFEKLSPTTGLVVKRADALAITDSTPTINWEVNSDGQADIIGICGIEQVDPGVAAPGDTPFFGANF